FSSRRRHTRWPRDWSSDVCSSDLDRLRVAQHRVREGREVKIVAKQHFGRHRLGDLNERTGRTKNDFEWIDGLRFGELLGGQQGRSEERRVGKECRERGGAEGGEGE